MSEFKSTQFLSNKFQDLHNEKSVDTSVRRARENGEVIQQKKIPRIEAHLDRLEVLANKLHDEKKFEHLKSWIIKRYVPSIDNPTDLRYLAKKLFQSERNIAVDEGRGGDVEALEAQGDEFLSHYEKSVKERIEAQKDTLSVWLSYLAHNEGDYPIWFRYYLIRSLEKMGRIDVENADFSLRTKTTFAPFPELNPEALSWAYAHLIDGITDRDNQTLSSEKLKQLEDRLVLKDFSKVYGFALIEVAGSVDRSSLEGEWRRYLKGSDPRVLEKDLENKSTHWCTASGHAPSQLSRGDFYTFFTKNKDGLYTEPRIAIRMVDDQIAELRGIDPGQELEPEFADIVAEKASQFPNGKEYFEIKEDVVRVTKLTKKMEHGEDFTSDDLSFIYEINQPIKHFGHRRDPRITKILEKRNAEKDISVLIESEETRIEMGRLYIEEIKNRYSSRNTSRLYDKVREIISLEFLTSCNLLPELKIALQQRIENESSAFRGFHEFCFNDAIFPEKERSELVVSVFKKWSSNYDRNKIKSLPNWCFDNNLRKLLFASDEFRAYYKIILGESLREAEITLELKEFAPELYAEYIVSEEFKNRFKKIINDEAQVKWRFELPNRYKKIAPEMFEEVINSDEYKGSKIELFLKRLESGEHFIVYYEKNKQNLIQDIDQEKFKNAFKNGVHKTISSGKSLAPFLKIDEGLVNSLVSSEEGQSIIEDTLLTFISTDAAVRLNISIDNVLSLNPSSTIIDSVLLRFNKNFSIGFNRKGWSFVAFMAYIRKHDLEGSLENFDQLNQKVVDSMYRSISFDELELEIMKQADSLLQETALAILEGRVFSMMRSTSKHEFAMLHKPKDITLPCYQRAFINALPSLVAIDFKRVKYLALLCKTDEAFFQDSSLQESLVGYLVAQYKETGIFPGDVFNPTPETRREALKIIFRRKSKLNEDCSDLQDIDPEFYREYFSANSKKKEIAKIMHDVKNGEITENVVMFFEENGFKDDRCMDAYKVGVFKSLDDEKRLASYKSLNESQFNEIFVSEEGKEYLQKAIFKKISESKSFKYLFDLAGFVVEIPVEKESVFVHALGCKYFDGIFDSDLELIMPNENIRKQALVKAFLMRVKDNLATKDLIALDPSLTGNVETPEYSKIKFETLIKNLKDGMSIVKIEADEAFSLYDIGEAFAQAVLWRISHDKDVSLLLEYSRAEEVLCTLRFQNELETMSDKEVYEELVRKVS